MNITAQQARTLATLNASMATLREIAALPEVGALALQRALVAAQTANDSCLELEASMAANAFLARLMAA